MTLAEIIECEIPRAMLERVVTDQDIIRLAERGALFKPSGLSANEVACRVVERYGSHAPMLAYGLYEQTKRTEWKTADRLIEHFIADDPEFHNHQASLVSRLPNLPLDKLNEFLSKITGQICQIVSINAFGRTVLGTGFLVGPDLVLTCKHVLKHFPTDVGLPNPARVEVYFDYYLGGPVRALYPDLPKARKVALAQNWYVDSSPDTYPDGILAPLPPHEVPRVSSALDFLLFRLAEKVGLQTVDRNGGRCRRWVDVSAGKIPQVIRFNDWVIIPQHPEGQPQRVDLGRFQQHDCTGTRLRYDTNTAAGTSGAPCFNQDFQLVGLHNAYVGPQQSPIFNQAISASCIAPLLQKHLKFVPVVRSVDRWSVTQDGKDPRVILGRQSLLSWLRASPADYAGPLTHRIYSACADVPAAGCTFSIDVLEAEGRDKKLPRAVYGQRGQQLPSTAEDFLLSLLRQLEIDLPSGETVPYRPRPLSAEAATIGKINEVDKLERWISQELPEWLGRTIETHVQKKIDIRDEAKKAVQTQIRLGQKVSNDLQETADSMEPVIVRANAWDFAYIVLDDLRSSQYSGPGPRTELKGEVLRLIAALGRGKSEAEVHPGLKRLRWMFLGYLPDFVPAASSNGGGATVELLKPEAVGAQEIVVIFERMAQAHARMKTGSDIYFPAVAKFVAGSAVSDPVLRLNALQTATSNYAKILLKELEV